MLDINKQIEFWKDGAFEDLEVARELVFNKRYRHVFFSSSFAGKIIKSSYLQKNK
jgi:HEPN domain-containing protein